MANIEWGSDIIHIEKILFWNKWGRSKKKRELQHNPRTSHHN
jgi:hypothetical protein